MSKRASKADLAALRATIHRLERGAAKTDRPGFFLGADALDRVLPGRGLALGGVHEILPVRPEWDDGVLLGFALALLRRCLAAAGGEGWVLWISRRGDLYGPAARAWGLPAERLLLARPDSWDDVLWAFEEGLRASALAAVVAEVDRLEAKPARRLQLAAEENGVTAFLLRRAAGATALVAPTASSRWRVTAAPGRRDALAPWPPRWRVDLLRCRGGRPGAFLVEWDHETGDFPMAAALCERASAAAAGVG